MTGRNFVIFNCEYFNLKDFEPNLKAEVFLNSCSIKNNHLLQLISDIRPSPTKSVKSYNRGSDLSLGQDKNKKRRRDKFGDKLYN